MAVIKGLEGLTPEALEQEVGRGGKFVLYEYCVSVLILTFKQPSDIYFIRAGESPVGKGLKYTLLSLVAGWWGFPWGPIYTFIALATNFGGGKDVTHEVMSDIRRQAGSQQPQYQQYPQFPPRY